MKRLKYIGMAIVVLGAIVAMLLYNKAKVQAKTKPDVIDSYSVSVTTVAIQKISENISSVGVTAAYNDVNVISETQGRVTAVYAKVGDYKPAGSVLFQVDDEVKKANFNLAEANYQKTKKDLERYEMLVKQKSATDAQYEAAKLANSNAEANYIVAKRQLKDTKITTPISGVVASRLVDVGSMVQGAPQATLVANVVDISKLKVKVNVSETDAFKLKTGDKVDITTEVYPGVKLEGKIETISSKGDEAHTYPVEIVVSNGGKYPLKAGMFARVYFKTIQRNEMLAIPREALVGSVKVPQVFVVENGVAKLRNIILGGEYGTNVEVVSGLSTGETIVTSGQNNLTDNVKVDIMK
jgi:RND family efflux transporter MFP subunit